MTIGQWQAVMGLDVRGQLMKAIDDDTLYDLGGKLQTKRDYMHFSRERADEYSRRKRRSADVFRQLG